MPVIQRKRPDPGKAQVGARSRQEPHYDHDQVSIWEFIVAAAARHGQRVALSRNSNADTDYYTCLLGALLW